ncbi:hypothetical protein ACK330_10940 [Aeromonas taiwanensis]
MTTKATPMMCSGWGMPHMLTVITPELVQAGVKKASVLAAVRLQTVVMQMVIPGAAPQLGSAIQLSQMVSTVMAMLSAKPVTNLVATNQSKNGYQHIHGKSNQDNEKAECHKVIQIAPTGFAETPAPCCKRNKCQGEAETERF